MNICIADNLKLLRYKHDYTLEAIAEIISVSRQSVAKWEAGDSVPDIVLSGNLPANIREISCHFEVSAKVITAAFGHHAYFGIRTVYSSV